MPSKKVMRYYNETVLDYERVWRTNKTLGIHYGYHDAKHKTHIKAVLNMNAVVANSVNITSKDHVLDAGCGIGGSSIWIAKEKGAKVTGLNINDMQLRKAKELAKKHNVTDKVNFTKGDFTKIPFPKNSFDVFFGLESTCYAESKKDLLKEAKRVLKKDGRLVIADGMLLKENLTKKEKEEMHIWLDGWAVPNLATPNQFKEYLKELGFKNIKYKDIKKNVMPSSIRLYRSSLIGLPIGKVLELLGIRSKTQTKNILGAYYQYKTIKKNLWTYGIITAQKK
jgi:ubiquinone/menaquinone biosynthesis C-methylase UbiE